MFLSPNQIEQQAIRTIQKITQSSTQALVQVENVETRDPTQVALLSTAGAYLIKIGTALQQEARPLATDISTEPQC